MQTEPLFDLPARVSALVARAEAAGWLTWTTYAAGTKGAFDTVCVRFRRHDPVVKKCYAIWELTRSDAGKVSVKWAGISASMDGARLATLKALEAYLFSHDADAPAGASTD